MLTILIPRFTGNVEHGSNKIPYHDSEMAMAWLMLIRNICNKL